MLGLFLCGKSGVIDVPGGTVCVPGDARTPILIWVPPPGGPICIPGDTSTPLVGLIWFHHRAEQSGTGATCAPIGWDSLGSTTGRNNLRLLSSLICVSWENCSPLVGFIWVPGAIRAPAGGTVWVPGATCPPVAGTVPGASRAPVGWPIGVPVASRGNRLGSRRSSWSSRSPGSGNGSGSRI